jgi:hypothetical protein
VESGWTATGSRHHGYLPDSLRVGIECRGIHIVRRQPRLCQRGDTYTKRLDEGKGDVHPGSAGGRRTRAATGIRSGDIIAIGTGTYIPDQSIHHAYVGRTRCHTRDDVVGELGQCGVLRQTQPQEGETYSQGQKLHTDREVNT